MALYSYSRFLTVVLGLCLLSLTIFQTTSAQTQPGQVEISGGGGFSPPLLKYLVGDKTSQVFDEITDYFITSRYYITNRFAIGLAGGSHIISGYISSDWASYTGNAVYSFTQVNSTIATEITYLYKRKKFFQSYGSVRVGIASFHEERSDFNSNYGTYSRFPVSGYVSTYNVTFLGIRYGEELAFFAELGSGYKGMISGGLSIRFSTKKKKTADIYPSIK